MIELNLEKLVMMSVMGEVAPRVDPRANIARYLGTRPELFA